MNRVAAILGIGAVSVLLSMGAEYYTPPGHYTTSWVGNTFPGNGGPNGFGYWVRNGADEIEVTPDGTEMAGTDWDEAGRYVGRFKDRKVNRVLLKQETAQETAWGWNTGNEAIAVEDWRGKNLLYRWSP